MHAAECELYRRSLSAFVRAAWPVLEPGTEFLANWHIDLIAEYLEAVTRGEVTRLVINMPPRYMKSLMVSVFWPCWEWTIRPETRWMFASYSKDLSTKHSVDRRQVIESEWYAERWGKTVRLSDDANLKTEFMNTRRGVMVATSVGGSATGKGGDRVVCLSPDTKVSTDLGRIPIGDVVERRLPVRVLSFNHSIGAYVFGKIDAYESAPGRSSVRVWFSDGRSIDATDDHPVYVRGSGYIAAGELGPGDEVVVDNDPYLHGLLQGVRSSAGQGRKDDAGSGVLRPCLSRDMAEGSEQSVMGRGADGSHLRAMRGDVPGQAGAHPKGAGAVLLQDMPERPQPGVLSAFAEPDARLRGLRGGVQDEVVDPCDESVLLQVVPGGESFARDRGAEQPPLRPRDERGAVFAGVPEDRSDDPQTRPSCLPPLWQDAGAERDGPGLSSRRLRQGQQRPDQPDFAVQVVPRGHARWEFEPPKVDGTVVEAVERIPAPERVYNVRVEGWHNYFASGVLVHNCDDPHNPVQAESDVQRQSAVTFFDRTLSNRLDDKKKGAIVVVMQRLHEDDVSARCLELGYTHLKLPAEARGRTVVAFPSGREVVREDGELLWEAREGRKEIADAKSAMGSYAYAGQYEQEPAPPGGGMFQKAWFDTDDAAPADAPRVRYWDKAGTEGGGAYTAGVLMARRSDGLFFVVDVVRGQWSAGERERVIKQTAEADGKNVAVWVEQEPGSGGKESAQNTVINLAGWNVRAEPVTGDKVARARPFAAQAEALNVRLVRDTPARRWNAAFLDELVMFPNGKYKDQVDAGSGAFNKLALVPRPGPSAVAGKRPTLAVPAVRYGGHR